jgi:hypothetical protein
MILGTQGVLEMHPIELCDIRKLIQQSGKSCDLLDETPMKSNEQRGSETVRHGTKDRNIFFIKSNI